MQPQSRVDNKKILKNIYPYLAVIGIVLVTLCVIYKGVDIQLSLIDAGADDYGVFYIIKTIKETGWYLVNPRVGGVTGGDLYDYVYSDSLSFLIIKLISLFVGNVYMIGNLFYFLNYFMVSCSSLYVCRKLKISNNISIVISVLYAFSVFMQRRYCHMWLTPYFLLPLSCLVAIWICEGAILNKQEKFWKSRRFYQSVVVSFFAASTGFYYAFFTCIIYAIAIVIRIITLGIKRYRKEVYSFFFIFSTIIGVCLNVIPNVIYWIQNGTNSRGELVTRELGGSETFALKLIQLFLPRIDHRNSLLRNIANKYIQNYPLVNENETAALGIVASIGMIIALVWIFSKVEGKKRICSLLILGLFLVGTVGGVGSIFSLFVQTPMRSYNRISLMIMFLCLLCFAFVLDDIRIKLKKGLWGILLMVILLVGLYDQTVSYVKPVNRAYNVESTRDFIAQMESQLEVDTLVFQLPYVNWPSGGNYRLFAGYLESDELKWSFGAMQGRSEALWQENVAASDVDTMLTALIENGYGAVYLDLPLYVQQAGQEAADNICRELTEILEIQPVISNNGELYFWNLKNFK